MASSGLQVVRYGQYGAGTAREVGETKIRQFLAYFRSLIPEQIDYRQVLLGVAVTTFSFGTGYGLYQSFKKYQWARALQAKRLGIEVGPGRTMYNNGNGNETDSENGTQPQGVVIVHQCPRGRRVPSIAPYPLKLETFLRVHGIRYEVDFTNEGPRHDDCTWITLDLEDIVDSENCIRYVCEKYNLDPDSHVDNSIKPIGLAYTHLLDHHLYWGVALWRWVYDNARHLSDIQFLPPKTMGMIQSVCRTVEQAAWFHGIGKKKPREVVAAMLDDIHALSEFLGNKTYFLNDEKPSELDCTAFSLLAQMLWNMDGSPYHEAITENFQNLANFCYRMREKYWPDWELCLNNDPVPDTESAGYLHEA